MRVDDGRVISNFVTRAIRGEPLTVYGDGSQTRSLCYVDDLVTGLLALLDSDCADPVNLGSDDERTVLDVAQLVLEVSGSSSGIVFTSRPVDEPSRRCPDLTRARERARMDAAHGSPGRLGPHHRVVQRASRPVKATASSRERRDPERPADDGGPGGRHRRQLQRGRTGGCLPGFVAGQRGGHRDRGGQRFGGWLRPGRAREGRPMASPTGANLGYGGAANRGAGAPEARAARFLVVGNPDLELGPGAVDVLVASLDADPSLGIVGPSLWNDDGSLYPSARTFPDLVDAIGHGLLGMIAPANPFTRRYRLLDWDHRRPARVDWVSGACSSPVARRGTRSTASIRPISCIWKTWTCAGGCTRPAGPSATSRRLGCATSRASRPTVIRTGCWRPITALCGDSPGGRPRVQAGRAFPWWRPDWRLVWPSRLSTIAWADPTGRGSGRR